MTKAFQSVGVRALGVSIAFISGALLIVIVLSALAVFAPANDPMGNLQSWSRVDLQLLGYAALGGLIVDAVRGAAAACWPTKSGRG